MFALLRDYLENRSHVEPFAEFLKECKDIRGMEEMRHFDRLVAHGMCLMGAKSMYVDTVRRVENNDYDLNDFNIW